MPENLKSKLRKEDFIGSLDSEISAAVSIDSGNTFSSPADVSSPAGTLSRSSAIAASENNVYVAWEMLDGIQRPNEYISQHPWALAVRIDKEMYRRLHASNRTKRFNVVIPSLFSSLYSFKIVIRWNTARRNRK